MNDFDKFLEYFQNVEESLTDTICLVIFRTADRKICLRNVEHGGWWLPYKKVDSKKPWRNAVNEIVQVNKNYNLSN